VGPGSGTRTRDHVHLAQIFLKRQPIKFPDVADLLARLERRERSLIKMVWCVRFNGKEFRTIDIRSFFWSLVSRHHFPFQGPHFFAPLRRFLQRRDWACFWRACALAVACSLISNIPADGAFDLVMTQFEPNNVSAAEGDAWFQTTHWSVVLLAGQDSSTQTQAALAKLCQAYWYPLYVFVRREGQTHENAQDLVQGFFAKAIEKNFVAAAEPEKGRFRSFLLLALKRYMANEWDRAKRAKRGGAIEILSLDAQDTELRYKTEPAVEMSPQKAFERQWALTSLQLVLDRLSLEFSAQGKARVFEELKVFLNGEKGGSYAEIGARLGMTEGAVKVTVHRLRQRYRELLRLEIANTVSSSEAIDDEIRSLLAALS
jgi:RNA polymerase sigma factor (sigma-70 family)